MTVSERTVLVAYGSELGNAQDMAEEAGRLCQRLHFQTHVEELDAVDLGDLLRYRLVVFVVSTTGQGDMPHNSMLFWKKLLRKRLSPGCLASVRYTCLGLGDSTYVKFNWAARKLIRRLEQLGASPFIEPQEADEQFPDGIEGVFAQWAEGLRRHLLEHYPLPDGLEPIPEDEMLPARWSLEPALALLSNPREESPDPAQPNGHTPPPLTDDSPPGDLLAVPNAWTATFVEAKRLTPETHWQDVRLFSFDIPSQPRNGSRDAQKLHCNPGDCLTIYPKNFPPDAQKLITLMGWDAIADQPLDLGACASSLLPRGLHVPRHPRRPSLRDLLLNSVDITAVPRRSFLKSAAYFAADPDHRQRLLEFAEARFLDEYFDYATRTRRTIVEVLEEFSSVRLPAARLLDVFPLIRGRDFSVANGGASLAHPQRAGDVTRVELLAALVRYRTVLRKPREGLCSRYLASLAPGCVISVTQKPVLSPVHGPDNARRPLVAMATGTGLAPVRCLIQERLTHPSPGPMILFFGNRNRANDFFFEDEWRALADHVVLFTAFSRDQRQKIYVQDLLRQESQRMAGLIPQRAIFSVCGGSSKMADACKAAVFDPFAQGGEEESRRKMLESVTWWQEIW